MTRTPPPAERGETEDRLILLCAVGALGTSTEDQLLRFAVEAELFPQFRFLLLLRSLSEEGLVTSRKNAEGRLFFLSPEGRETLRLFSSEIRPSVQARIAQYAPGLKRQYRDERQLPAGWRETENGIEVTLRALEDGKEMLSVRLFAENRADAQRFCERWPEAAQEVYGTLIQALSRKKES